jgi:C_GCAxxG_C_C family probable redox protein
MNTNHADKAAELFASGYNCAQSVFAAFSDVTGIDTETSLKLASSFGAGMGRMREVCGACSGIFMAAGIIYGYSSPDDNKAKAAHYALIQSLADSFKDVYGTIICRELLKNIKTDSSPIPEERTERYYKVRPCIRFVITAAEILDKFILENPKSAK